MGKCLFTGLPKKELLIDNKSQTKSLNLTHSYPQTSTKITVDLKRTAARGGLLFFMTTVTNYHKCSGLQQHKFMIFLFCSSGFQNESHSAKIKVLERLHLQALGNNPFSFLSKLQTLPLFLGSCSPSAIFKARMVSSAFITFILTLFLFTSLQRPLMITLESPG